MCEVRIIIAGAAPLAIGFRPYRACHNNNSYLSTIIRIRVPSARQKHFTFIILFLVAVVGVFTNNSKQTHAEIKQPEFFHHVPAEHLVGRKHWMNIPACRRYAMCLTEAICTIRSSGTDKKNTIISTHNAPRWGAVCRNPAIDGIHRIAYSTSNFLYDAV